MVSPKFGRPEALATHAAAVLAKLEHSDWRVRLAAVETLGQLPPKVLVTHAAAVVAKLEDSDGGEYLRNRAQPDLIFMCDSCRRKVLAAMRAHS